MKVYEIPEYGKNSKGRAIQNLLMIDADDRVNAFIRVAKGKEEGYADTHNLIFATKNGIIKKTKLREYAYIPVNGKKPSRFSMATA